MLGVLPFVEDPDLSWTAGPAVPQLLPPCCVQKPNELKGCETANDPLSAWWNGHLSFMSNVKPFTMANEICISLTCCTDDKYEVYN